MSTIRGAFVSAGLAVALAAAPAHAQIAFGLAGGATVPSNDLHDRSNLGYNGLATLQLGVPTFPFQVRADLQYNSFGGKDFIDALNVATKGKDARVIAGSINGVFTLLPGPIKPYIIGGVGYYDTKFDGNDATRKLGYNYGAGVKFGLTGASIFVEARMHQVNDALFTVSSGRRTAKFIPITIGVMF